MTALADMRSICDSWRSCYKDEDSRPTDCVN